MAKSTIDEKLLKNGTVDGYIDSKAGISSNFTAKIEDLANKHLKSTGLDLKGFTTGLMNLVSNASKMGVPDERKINQALTQIGQVAEQYEGGRATISHVYSVISQLGESLARDTTSLITLRNMLNLGKQASLTPQETYLDVVENIHGITGRDPYELADTALEESMNKYIIR